MISVSSTFARVALPRPVMLAAALLTMGSLACGEPSGSFDQSFPESGTPSDDAGSIADSGQGRLTEGGAGGGHDAGDDAGDDQTNTGDDAASDSGPISPPDAGPPPDSGGIAPPPPLCTTANRARAAAIVAQMTLAEKISQMHGIAGSSPDQRAVADIPRLSVPRFILTNGPNGATNGTVTPVPPATAMPCALALAATWDTALARAYGVVLGNEARVLGNDLIEGPDMNLARIPQGGRTFENLGEDPVLAGTLAVAEIGGIQSQGEIGEAKHFAGNEQEANRKNMNAVIDARTLRELYLLPFEMSVKQGGVGAVMCAYPQVNGTASCENTDLLKTILKGEWAFDGLVTSDFGAVHSTVASALNGLDCEALSNNYYGAPLQAAVMGGMVPETVIDEHIVRRFCTTMGLGLWDNPPTATPISSALQTADGAQARQTAAAAIVLLKNSGGLLPLDATKLHNVALIGPYAVAAKTGGGGSSAVVPLYTVTPQAGVQAAAGTGVKVAALDGSSLSAAQTAAAAADVVLVMVGDSRAEGKDSDIALSGNQNALVAAMVSANPKTIVVVKSGSAVLMPWASQVPAILEAWYPGEEDGNAVADVVFGAVNPSGKLPMTFPAALADLPANTPSQYPSAASSSIVTATYSEGLLMGYRSYDARNVTPLFPFGFGLSYTTFTYANLKVTPDPSGSVTVEFDVTNSGGRSGAELAQVYVAMPAAAMEPPHLLKGFQKLALSAGQTGHAMIALDVRAFQHWDVATSAWVTTPGDYGILVGSSSRDIRIQSTVTR
jgi:beta-glucosidase